MITYEPLWPKMMLDLNQSKAHEQKQGVIAQYETGEHATINLEHLIISPANPYIVPQKILGM